MKLAVIGTGLIGSQVVEILNASGHHAEPHSPNTGLDLLSGKGLAEALNGTDVVSSSPHRHTLSTIHPSSGTEASARRGGTAMRVRRTAATNH
jgi:homoserine dehydrogenase